MKRIAILCNGYNIVTRGSERYTIELAKLLKNDYKISILSAHTTQTKTRNQIKFPNRNIRAYLESYYFGKEWYRSNGIGNYDLIINNAGFPTSRWVAKHRKKTGTKYIVFERGGGTEEKINHLFYPDRIGYLTQYSYKKSKNPNKVYLPIGINIEEYQKKQKEPEFMKELEMPIYLSTSALVKFKRIPLLIDVVSKLKKGTLLQTSDGNLKDKICKYGLKKLGTRFHYTGNVSREVLLGLYQHSDYFLSASKHEAFGIVYLEAQASGLPVIAQYDERRAEIVGEGGYLTDFATPYLVTETLKCMRKEDYNPLAQAEKFDWKILKPKYLEVIEELT